MINLLASRQPFATNRTLSNSVYFSQIRLVDVLAGMNSGATWISLARQFLHESTHHDSKLSIVGSALLAATFNPAIAKGDLDKEELDDLEFSQNLRLMFDPLLEGLATFTEFDATPGASPVGSSMMQRLGFAVVARSFTSLRQVLKSSAGDPLDLTSTLLLHSRLTEDAVEQKRILLSLPMKDPYLSGYCFIKRLRFLLSNSDQLRNDTDLVAGFLNHYFMSDYTLGNLILETEEAPFFRLIAIHDYLNERLRLLLRRGDEFVTEFVEFSKVHDGNPLNSPLLSYSNLSPGIDVEFQERLERRVSRKPSINVNLFGPARACFRFVSSDCLVVKKSSEQAEVLSADIPSFTLNILPDVQPWWSLLTDGESLDGHLELGWLPAPNYEEIMFVCTEVGLVGTIDPHSGESNPEVMGYWREDFISLHVEKSINETLASLWKMRTDMSFVRVVGSYALNWGLGRAFDDLPDATRDAMAESGFAGLFRDRPDLFELLVRLSLVVACQPGIRIDSNLGDRINLNSDSVRQIQAIGLEALGDKLLITDENRIWFSMI